MSFEGLNNKKTSDLPETKIHGYAFFPSSHMVQKLSLWQSSKGSHSLRSHIAQTRDGAQVTPATCAQLIDRIKDSEALEIKIADVFRNTAMLKWDWVEHVCRMPHDLRAKVITEWTSESTAWPTSNKTEKWAWLYLA